MRAKSRLPLVLTFAAVLFGLHLPANAAAEIPPQQPGVTLRVFDVQVPLDQLCTLKPAQTPNVDKLMPVVDWTTQTDFGFADRFVAQVTGNINIPQAGSYTFRL